MKKTIMKLSVIALLAGVANATIYVSPPDIDAYKKKTDQTFYDMYQNKNSVIAQGANSKLKGYVNNIKTSNRMFEGDTLMAVSQGYIQGTSIKPGTSGVVRVFGYRFKIGVDNTGSIKVTPIQRLPKWIYIKNNNIIYDGSKDINKKAIQSCGEWEKASIFFTPAEWAYERVKTVYTSNICKKVKAKVPYAIFNPITGVLTYNIKVFEGNNYYYEYLKRVHDSFIKTKRRYLARWLWKPTPAGDLGRDRTINKYPNVVFLRYYGYAQEYGKIYFSYLRKYGSKLAITGKTKPSGIESVTYTTYNLPSLIKGNTEVRLKIGNVYYTMKNGGVNKPLPVWDEKVLSVSNNVKTSKNSSSVWNRLKSFFHF